MDSPEELEQDELLKFAVQVLERLGLPYVVTGSMASMMFGEPRLTNDIDIVVRLPIARIREFCSQFLQADYYVSEDAARDAVQSQSMFNVIHPASGLKIDFIVAKATPFGRAQLERGRRMTFGDRTPHEAVFCSPEDIILNKLLFYQEGGSEKHLRDITGVLSTSGAELDRPYIERWAYQLGVFDVWRVALARSEQQPERE